MAKKIRFLNSSYLLAGGLALLTQLRFTYQPSLISPGGLTHTRVFFGESKQKKSNTSVLRSDSYYQNIFACSFCAVHMLEIRQSPYSCNNIKKHLMDLQVTLSRNGLERSVPSELRATQWYSPLSVYLRWERWSWGLKLSGMLPLSISGEQKDTCSLVLAWFQIIWKKCLHTVLENEDQRPAFPMKTFKTSTLFVQFLWRNILWHTFEPCKALYRWSCITGAGQGNWPPLWYLPYWEDCYGSEVRSICRGEEKHTWE